MNLDRRRLFAALAGAGAAGAASTAGETQAMSPRELGLRAEIDAVSLGIRPNAAEDQTQNFQRAIDQAAAARAVLRLPPGVYRAGALTLPPYAAIAGVTGATRIVMTGGPSMMSATGSDYVGVSGLVLDGGNIPLPERHGLLHFVQARFLRIADCEIINAGRNGIALEAIDGEVTGNTISAADGAIFSLDARGLKIAGNTVRGAGNGGILVWRSERDDDGTLVIDNRIEGIMNKAGGSGQYGNAVNVFRADNVIVRGNRIRNAAFSAVRGNAASNLQIIGNTCTGLGEVALYAEFGFEGALIANNIVDGAAVGVSVTNFNQGGRLAIVQGNLIRNLVGRRPPGTDPNDLAGIGIGVEADTSVTGNVVENAANAGIAAGWGAYLRDVAISSNVIRRADFGVTVSVAPGAGAAVIADNMISDVRSGAIVGMEWKKPVTGDLTKDGAARYAQLSIGGNRVR
ncbi:MAG: TIGR03808 family TAT-translocated repetitive protein [Xanthobacteraceae bacterium]|nr:TIGR03808 family TAT-translocated repetitive protein [Xanthobacteraceae bacterium]